MRETNKQPKRRIAERTTMTDNRYSFEPSALSESTRNKMLNAAAQPSLANGQQQGECPECHFVRYRNEAEYHSFECSQRPSSKKPIPAGPDHFTAAVVRAALMDVADDADTSGWLLWDSQFTQSTKDSVSDEEREAIVNKGRLGFADAVIARAKQLAQGKG